MDICADSLDDLLRRVLKKLLRREGTIDATRGENTELIGVLLQLKKPRARLSHTERKGRIFSSLGELLWYLAKSDSLNFIKYYLRKYKKESEDGETLYGAYGPRLYAMHERYDQIKNVLELLRDKPHTRRAVIQLFQAADIARPHREIPCTCSFQFLVRSGRLEMLTYMRSNDAFLGLPHDVFAFTMLQEMIACDLGLRLGRYRHFVGSLHLYTEHRDKAQQYVDEGWQPLRLSAMPPMPHGTPWPSVSKLLDVEAEIREREKVDLASLDLDPYWADLARLLQIYREANPKTIQGLQEQMSTDVFNAFIERRGEAKRKKRTTRRRKKTAQKKSGSQGSKGETS